MLHLRFMWTVPFGSIHCLNKSTFPYSLRGTMPSLATGGTYSVVCHSPNISNTLSLSRTPES